MLPALRPGQIVVGQRGRKLRVGDVVIFKHGGLQKIKRVRSIKNDKFYLLGDNAPKSTDSRSFGWLSKNMIEAKIIWPRI